MSGDIPNLQQAERLMAGEHDKAWTFESKAVASKFDQHVREQLSWYEPLSGFVADIAASFLPRGGVLYDIGASTGNMTTRMAEVIDAKSAIAVSIEPSHAMAKLWQGAGELRVLSAEDFNFGNRPPDVSLLFLVLMFMPTAYRDTFLRRLMGNTNPGGCIIIIDKGYLHNPKIQVAVKTAHLAEKKRAGTPADSYITKELSLRGELRPTDMAGILELADGMDFKGEEIFRFGEFYGLLLSKRSI